MSVRDPVVRKEGRAMNRTGGREERSWGSRKIGRSTKCLLFVR